MEGRMAGEDRKMRVFYEKFQKTIAISKKVCYNIKVM